MDALIGQFEASAPAPPVAERNLIENAMDSADDPELYPDMHAMAAELIDIRSTWKHDEDQQLYFYVHNRGGAWLAEHKGKSGDSATAMARSEAKAFCLQFHWPQQRGFGYSKFGSIDNANRLAREVARLGHWY